MTRFAYICRNGRCVLRADGHAAYCPGSDIVCAGASALMCALAGALDTLGAQGVQRTLSAGHAAIAADDRTDVRAAFTVAVTGLRQLAEAYPGHVAEDTGRAPRTGRTQRQHSGRVLPGAVPGSGQQRKKGDMSMENIRMDLRLFDANTQVTTQQSLTEEMKTFYSDYLIDAAEPELVHDQFAQKHPIPANGGKTIQFRRFAPLGKALTALTEGVTPRRAESEHEHR